jgi:AcrR family transcriptional regulator
MSPARTRETRLSRELQSPPPARRVTPQDAFALAQRKWLKGERLEIGALAEELGVARATLFRWVGNRELLLGEVIWHLFQSLWQRAAAQARGRGGDYAADFTRHLLQLALNSAPLRRFIEQDAEYALRILTSKSSPVQARVIAAVARLLQERADAGDIVPALSIEDLAYVIVRIVQSCMYSDPIAGKQPNIAASCDAIRILVSAKPGRGRARDGSRVR